MTADCDLVRHRPCQSAQAPDDARRGDLQLRLGHLLTKARLHAELGETELRDSLIRQALRTLAWAPSAQRSGELARRARLLVHQVLAIRPWRTEAMPDVLGDAAVRDDAERRRFKRFALPILQVHIGTRIFGSMNWCVEGLAFAGAAIELSPMMVVPVEVWCAGGVRLYRDCARLVQIDADRQICRIALLGHTHGMLALPVFLDAGGC